MELDRKVGEAIDIYVNNRLVARGEVVVVEDRLGVTMTEIIKSDRRSCARCQETAVWYQIFVMRLLIVGTMEGYITAGQDRPRSRPRSPTPTASTRR